MKEPISVQSLGRWYYNNNWDLYCDISVSLLSGTCKIYLSNLFYFSIILLLLLFRFSFCLIFFSIFQLRIINSYSLRKWNLNKYFKTFPLSYSYFNVKLYINSYKKLEIYYDAFRYWYNTCINNINVSWLQMPLNLK